MSKTVFTFQRSFAALALLLLPIGSAEGRSDDISSMKALLEYDLSRKDSDCRDLSGQLEHLKKAVVYAPDSAVLYAELGFCYINLKQPGTAKVYLDKALSLRADGREILSRRAFSCLMCNDLATAIDDLKKCLSINKIEPGYIEEGPDAQNLLRALSHSKWRGQLQSAEKQYGKLKPLFASMEAREALELDKALALVSKVVTDLPERAVPRLIKAVTLLDMRRYPQAERELDILLKGEPGNPTLLYFRAEARRLSENVGGALADYDKILASGRMLIARKYTAGTGKHRDNRVFYDDWIVTPADIHFLRASIYQDRSDLKRAEASITSACALSPDDADTLLLAANIAVRCKQLDKARQYAGRVRKTSAAGERIRDIDLFIEAGSSEAGRSRAMNSYRDWLKKDCDKPAVLYVIARRLEGMKEYKDAAEAWSTLVSILPREADAKLHFAHCLFALGENAKAAALLAEARKQGASAQDCMRVGVPVK